MLLVSVNIIFSILLLLSALWWFVWTSDFYKSISFFLLPFSQPLVPRENITAWMNAIGLVITALPVRKAFT